MSNTLSITGTITVGPPSICDSTFPAATTNIPFGTGGCGPCSGVPVPALVQGSQNVNSPSSYVTVQGVGAGGLVTQALHLYIRSQAKMYIRLTINPDSGGNIISVLLLQGTFIFDAPTTNYISLIEVQGVGTIEFLAGGNV